MLRLWFALWRRDVAVRKLTRLNRMHANQIRGSWTSHRLRMDIAELRATRWERIAREIEQRSLNALHRSWQAGYDRHIEDESARRANGGN
jgi:hypothetical protein